MDRGPSPTNLLSRLLSLSPGLLPLFLWTSPDTWTRSGPATEPVSLPEADVPADSTPISGTLLISSSLSIPKTTHTPQNLCLYIYIIKYCNEKILTLYKILLKNASGGNNEDFFTRGFSQWKWFPGIYRDRPTWGNLEFYKTQMETPIFLLISSRRKLIIHGDIFFFKLQTLWRKLHPEESFHISTKPRLEIGKYHWNRRENKNLKIKRSYEVQKVKIFARKN